MKNLKKVFLSEKVCVIKKNDDRKEHFLPNFWDKYMIRLEFNLGGRSNGNKMGIQV